MKTVSIIASRVLNSELFKDTRDLNQLALA